MDGTCRQDFEGNPRLFDRGHELDRLFRVVAEHVVVVVVMFPGHRLVPAPILARVLRCGRPVSFMMERLVIEVGPQLLRLGDLGDLE